MMSIIIFWDFFVSLITFVRGRPNDPMLNNED